MRSSNSTLCSTNLETTTINYIKMKKTILTSVLALVFVTGNLLATNPIKEIKVKDAKIVWTGKKVIGSHSGTIDLSEGTLIMEGQNIVGGTFIVDMTSLVTTDDLGGGKAKLEGHLKSSDFFNVEEFPTAKYEITAAKRDGSIYNIVGNLTIKGITKNVRMRLTMEDGEASTTLIVDRTKFGIKYGSASLVDTIKDKAIDDDFELNITFKI